MNNNIQAVLRPDAAAAFLTLSTQRLAQMRLDGSGPPFCKIGRTVTYRRADLEAWLSERRRMSTSDLGPQPTAA